ncbi:MAG: rod shape-determining protein RodA [Cellvibrionales bacterium]|nr:rod shape-determining protein RodA [Cellvibrionales bacterium]
MPPNNDYVRQIDSDGFKQPFSFWRFVNLDAWLFFLLVVLAVTGLFVLYSASDNGVSTIKRQGVYMLLGFGVMIIMAQIPMLFYKRLSPILYLLGVGLLVAVLVMGTGAKGAQRWLVIPGVISFQPSEIIKLAMPLMVAWFLAGQHLPPTFGKILVVLAIVAVPFVLVLIQPDLGTSLLIAASGLFVLFLSGLSYWYILGALGVMVAASYPIWLFVLKPYQKGRILTLLDPERDPFGAGWNIMQSTTAIGSGGLEGKGWMQGTQSQLNFLPESHTDFIIATLAEEFGFIGVLLLLLLYFLIFCRGLMLAWSATTLFNKLLAGALILTFFVYVFVNMAMVSGLLPVVGVPLPLVSRGGTSIVTLMASFGLIMAVASDKQQFSS